MTGSETHERVSELIPFYVNRSLPEEVCNLIEEHFATCGSCRADAEQWEQIAHAVVSQAEVESVVWESRARAIATLGRAANPRAAVVGPNLVYEKAKRRLSATFGHAWVLLRTEARLIRKSIWMASVGVIALGVVMQAVSTYPGAGSLFLQMLAPLFTAGAVSFAQAPDVSGSNEVFTAVPTSARTTLIARLSLVFGFNALSFGTAAWILGGNTGWATLEFVLHWFAPMAFLASFALLAAVLAGARAATAAAIALWWIRTVFESDEAIPGAVALSSLLHATRHVWESPSVWLFVLGQLTLAWWLAGRDSWTLRSSTSRSS